MRTDWTFVVGGDIRQVSPNQRLHWAVRAKRTRALRHSAYTEWLVAGRPRSSKPVKLFATVYRGRALDADNAIACLKPVIDGICKDALIPDDSPKWLVEITVRQEIGKQFAGKEQVKLYFTN
jgi:hypothetical protein